MLVEYIGENSGGTIFAKTEHVSVRGLFRDTRGELMNGELTICESQGELVPELILWTDYASKTGTVKVTGIIERSPSGAAGQ